MSGVRALSDPNHLPWLDDVRTAPPKEPGPLLLVVGAIGALVIAAAIVVWLAERAGSGIRVAAPATQLAEPPHTTMRLPALEPTPAPPSPLILLTPPGAMPATEPVPAVAQAAAERPPIVSPAPGPSAHRLARKPTRVASARPRAIARQTAQPRNLRGYWPQPAAAVGLGRVIRLSKYPSPGDAQRGWYALQRTYPQLHGLPTVMVANRAADGRQFYRLHVVTAARAQSDWLCNRLQRDLRHCTVLGAADSQG